MSDGSGRELTAEVRRVMEHVGHCLIIYQRIELYLKYLLPFVDGLNEAPIDTYARWKSLVEAKRTLGPLVEDLRISTRSSDPEWLSHYLDELVAHRNELVHLFSRLPFGGLRTLEDCDAALTHLSSRVEFAVPLHDALDGMLRQFRDQLIDLKLQTEDRSPERM